MQAGKLSDKHFLEWISRQPSCLDGGFSQWLNGEGRNIAAHVRRIKYGAGTGIKPKYRAVPLTHEQHMMQHHKGEAAVIKYYAGIDLTPEQAAEWFEQKAEYYEEKYWRSHT